MGARPERYTRKWENKPGAVGDGWAVEEASKVRRDRGRTLKLYRIWLVRMGEGLKGHAGETWVKSVEGSAMESRDLACKDRPSPVSWPCIWRDAQERSRGLSYGSRKVERPSQEKSDKPEWLRRRGRWKGARSVWTVIFLWDQTQENGSPRPGPRGCASQTHHSCAGDSGRIWASSTRRWTGRGGATCQVLRYLPLGSSYGRLRLDVLLSSLECHPPSRALCSVDSYSKNNLVHWVDLFPPPGKTFQSLFQSVWVSPNLNDIFEVIFTMLGLKNHDHFDFPRLWMALSSNNFFYLGCH